MKTIILAACITLAVLLLLLSRETPAADSTYGPGCRFEWTDMPEDEGRVTGYRLMVNASSKDLPATPLTVPCADAGLAVGVNKVRIRALGNGVISPLSNEVSFIYDPRNLSAPVLKIAVGVPK